MPLFSLLLQGLLIGFAVAAPVGPIGVLCIKQNLSRGFTSGISVGMGAAVADIFYGAIVAFSMIAIQSFFLKHAFYFQLIGGGILLYLGLQNLRHHHGQGTKHVINGNLWTIFITSFVLTILNPLTIIMYAGVFSAMAGNTYDLWSAIILVIGIFLGSMLWWLILSSLVYFTKNKLSPTVIRQIDIFSAVILIGFGFFSFTKAFGG